MRSTSRKRRGKRQEQTAAPDRSEEQETIIQLRAANAAFAPARGTERWLSGYADASYKADPPEAGGGWGCWVRDDHTRVIRSGPCPEWVRQSNDVELCAVFAAINTAARHLDAESANILVVKTDNQNVCRWFGWGGGHPPTKPEHVDLVRRSLQLVTDWRIRLVVTWVKGHRGTVDTQAYLNTQVDKLAAVARKTRQKTFERHAIVPVGLRVKDR